MGSIAENIKIIEERILEACLRSGRKREEITLMAVTKFMPIEAVKEAWDSGLRCFGESRVQEAVSKFDTFRTEHPGAQLHLIGALQRNKSKIAAAFFDCIQSVDRETLAEELAKHAAARNKGAALPILLELRTGEDSKSGFESLDGLFKAVELIAACPTLSICGLMTLAPNTVDEAPVRAAFRKLVLARQELENRFQNTGHSFACLSMGMSGDFETAIEEGSTMLRIGSAIFGDRI
ncbi:MAG: YggS family pyridoxal phosphate-dependent enzyme [Treponema sp.]|jgi:pyridoxal phosphate enzyme (YggS family)|nr:YggS family pyridoxal phosphate-dependent enzyme [Treponema sp.]